MPKIILYSSLLFLLIFFGCDRSGNKTFDLIESSQSNVHFNNKIIENDTFNVLSFEYIYNGSGVGVGDFNNDGLSDIFFAGNMVSSKLYLNKDKFSFEDVTKESKVETDLWCTGVSVVDINEDNLLDIYVSTIQPNKKGKSVPNLLFLNKGIDKNGVPLFEEVAAKTGLADTSYSTQAAFVDFDLDGDLDMYLLNNGQEDYNRNQAVGQKMDGTGNSVDKLYRNEGIENGLPHFTDVSKETGILSEGWGLGVVVNDLNQDGFPDIYAANDFLSNDHMFINDGKGYYKNEISSRLKHQEHNGMGVDIADINNDGLNDILVMDMMPYSNLRQKTMFGNIFFDRYKQYRSRGYQDQYVRNVLQINNGNNTFSDIGFLAGVYATDWSWSCLMADFDNDGFKDIFISNGYRKDVTDQDFLVYGREAAMFGTEKNRQKIIREEVEKLVDVRIPNFIFKNNKDLTFTDKSAEWGFDKNSLSNGVAYADLDNDGDLDLVVNNLNDEAFIYRNNTNTSQNKFLSIDLVGRRGKSSSLGAKVWLFDDGQTQYIENQVQRGFKSSVDGRLHFGLGLNSDSKVDSIIVTWPSGKTNLLKNVASNSRISIKESDATLPDKRNLPLTQIFTSVGKEANLNYQHKEDDFSDYFNGQLTIPHKLSQETPGMAVGDINGDELEDFIIGGSANQKAKIFYQTASGQFQSDSLQSKSSEDMGLLLFDADSDKDLDLYCVSGSSEFGEDIIHYQDRLYINNGKGKFQPDTTALPQTTSSGSCVTANDFDRDGDLDLFVGGRVIPKKYPLAPESYILENDGKGKFKDITTRLSKELKNIGMVSGALWTDHDNDGWVDLMTVGEWMPITIFKNQNGKTFKKIELPQTSGWWNSLAGGDFDNDGDVDYVAGNIGLNSIYKASEKEPVMVCAKDFDGNGTVESILCRYIQGKEYPVHPRETLTGQMPSLRNVLTRYSIYGQLGLKEIIPEEKLEGALILRSTQMASIYLQNEGNGRLIVKVLPIEAQFAPIYGINITDVNHDGNMDILSVGNSYASEPLTGFYDAGIGNYLQGDGKGNFKSVSVTQSGFFVPGDAKGFASLTLKSGEQLFLVTQNRDSLKVFKQQFKENSSEVMSVSQLQHSAEIILRNGKRRKQELYHGSGYLSSSSRKIIKDRAVKEVKLGK